MKLDDPASEFFEQRAHVLNCYTALDFEVIADGLREAGPAQGIWATPERTGTRNGINVHANDCLDRRACRKSPDLAA